MWECMGGQVVLDTMEKKKKQARQTMRNKWVSSTPPWLLHQLTASKFLP